LAIENRFGHGRIVQDETYGALALLQRERLKRENVDALFGEGLAELAKRSRSVFQTDCELLSGGHGRNLLAVYLVDGLEKVLRDPTMSRILLRRPACIKGETKSLYFLSYTAAALDWREQPGTKVLSVSPHHHENACLGKEYAWHCPS
jgi:hypothetical protein